MLIPIERIARLVSRSSRQRPRSVGVALLVALAAGSAGAQDTTASPFFTADSAFTHFPAAADSAKRPWTLEIDFGFVNASGNASTTTVNGQEAAGYTQGRWTLSQAVSAVSSQSEGTSTAENYQAKMRSDVRVADGFAWYVLGAWDRNVPGGIVRRFEEGSGAAYTVHDAAPTTLRLELGVSAFQQDPVAAASTNFAAGRAALFLKRMLGQTAFFQQALEALPNFQDSKDLRINSETAVVAPISTIVSLKLGYVLRYDHEPEPGKQTTDRLLTSGVTIVF